jgi:hypothetical protein
MLLPKPKDKLGYTKQELQIICKDRKISFSKFNKAFGVNTCAIGKDGTTRFYVCDVERALYELNNKDGKFHLWD